MPVAQLSRGETHYELAGPDDGRPVVLLHGGTIPMWTWDRQVPALTRGGFRVLRYDMFGRGESAFPAGPYGRDLYRTQLVELLDAVGLGRPVDVVGFSFGGATAANLAVRHPDRVGRLALVAPLLHYEAGNAIVRTTRLPFLGPPFLRFMIRKKMVARASLLWGDSVDSDRYKTLFRHQIERKGFPAAMLSFMRSDALGDYRETFRALGQSNRKVLLAWGTDDDDVPARDIASIRELIPDVEYVEMAGVGHGSIFIAAETINKVLLSFLTNDTN